MTDIDLVKAYFRLVSDGLFATPRPEKIKMEPMRSLVLKFFELKLVWPYRDPAVNRLGNYYFDGAQYMIDRIDYEALGCERSRFDQIFLSLSSALKAGKSFWPPKRSSRDMSMRLSRPILPVPEINLVMADWGSGWKGLRLWFTDPIL